jgi:hypothetical protein
MGQSDNQNGRARSYRRQILYFELKHALLVIEEVTQRVVDRKPARGRSSAKKSPGVKRSLSDSPCDAT